MKSVQMFLIVAWDPTTTPYVLSNASPELEDVKRWMLSAAEELIDDLVSVDVEQGQYPAEYKLIVSPDGMEVEVERKWAFVTTVGNFNIQSIAFDGVRVND